MVKPIQSITSRCKYRIVKQHGKYYPEQSEINHIWSKVTETVWGHLGYPIYEPVCFDTLQQAEEYIENITPKVVKEYQGGMMVTQDDIKTIRLASNIVNQSGRNAALAIRLDSIANVLEESLDVYCFLPNQSERDWKGDLKYENGSYMHRCPNCFKSFYGNKRRIECKVCCEGLEKESK